MNRFHSSRRFFICPGCKRRFLRRFRCRRCRRCRSCCNCNKGCRD